MKTYGKVYSTRREKTIDFLIGFLGCFLFNGLYGAVVWGFVSVYANTPNAAGTLADNLAGLLALIVAFLPLLLNGAALITFMFTRAWIALGILAAFAAAFIVVLCLGLVFMAVCFASFYPR